MTAFSLRAVSRAIPTFTPAHRVFGPSPLDHATYDYRTARDAPQTLDRAFAAADAALARAQAVRPEYRAQRVAEAQADRDALDARHAALVAAVPVAAEALRAAGGDPDAVDAADAARLAQHQADTAHMPSSGLVGAEDGEDWTVDMARVRAAGGRSAGV